MAFHLQCARTHPATLRKVVARALSGAVTAFAAMAVTLAPAVADPDSWKRAGWKTDFARTAVPWKEILSGGPPKDGIPAIDKPQFLPLDQVKDLKDVEPMITIAIGGKARAYPIRILMWHEIVNDTLAGRPISVTYCPLCNAALVFDRNVNGRILDFGTTGKLRNSDLIMYDRQTESWWQQFTGEGIVGAYTGTLLKLLPSRLESFARFKERYPKGEVLVPNNAHLRDYGRNPYARYDSRSGPYEMLYSGELTTDIAPMARVVVARDGTGAKSPAIALDLIKEKKKLTRDGITYHWAPGQASALDTPVIADGFDVGNVWVTRQRDGKTVDIPYDLTFAFVYRAFNKTGEIVSR